MLVIRKCYSAMGSISGTFALAAFIAGLFCTRLKTALIAGAVPALLYAALVVVGLWGILGDVDVPYFLGIMDGLHPGDSAAGGDRLLPQAGDRSARPSPQRFGAGLSAFACPCGRL
jgi:hypothetical protein